MTQDAAKLLWNENKAIILSAGAFLVLSIWDAPPYFFWLVGSFFGYWMGIRREKKKYDTR